MKEVNVIVQELKQKRKPDVREKQAYFGIDTSSSFGVSIPDIRLIAKKYRNNHALATQVWETGVHEARILATIIDNPHEVTKTQVKKWVADINSWDVCDALCGNLLVNVPWVYDILEDYCKSKAEFVKRCGFVLMAYSAVHHKQKTDKYFDSYFKLILKYGNDERNFVKKAVSWALRQIGKRNEVLKISATNIANELLTQNTPATNWIAKDVIRELSK